MSRRTTSNNVLLIDADSGVYACAFQAQKKSWYAYIVATMKVLATFDGKAKLNAWWKKEEKKYKDGEVDFDWTENLDPPAKVNEGVRAWRENIVEFSGCKRDILYLTKGGNCFRTRLSTIKRYKGNRLGTPKPHYYSHVREYLTKYLKAHVFHYWEADDAVCMTMAKGEENGNRYILAAIDKDLDQMPGPRFNPQHNGPKWREKEAARRKEAGDDTPVLDEGVYVITEVDGWRSFYKQMLTGDTVDNIPGLHGYGPKKADKILNECDTPEEMCAAVYECYAKAYPGVIEMTPWWWDPEWDDTDKYSEESRALALQYRDHHPVYGECNCMVHTAGSIFRENADLLYMLRSPTDQYIPHSDIPDFGTPYERGIVAEFTDFEPGE